MEWKQEKGVEFYCDAQENPDRSADVFYNPEMELNRDISVLSGCHFLENDSRIGDCFSASGVRALRYANQGFSNIVANDRSQKAVEAIKKGSERNNADIKIEKNMVNSFLQNRANSFDLLDLDPFGSFLEYLDSTARAIRHGSVVGLTATDLGPVSGSYPTVARRRYRSYTIRNSYMHEIGLRIYIKEAFSAFSRNNMCFKPQICFNESHYTRLIGTVYESKKAANRALENIGYIRHCHQCLFRTYVEKPFETPDECENCGSELDTAGPLWTGKLGNPQSAIPMSELAETKNWSNAKEMLQQLAAEYDVLTPYYDLHSLCSSLGISSPKTDDIISTLKSKGYITSQTHFSPTGFRTEAPIQEIRETVVRLG